MKLKTRMFVLFLLALALLPGLLCSARTANAKTTSDLFVCGTEVSDDKIEVNWKYVNSTNTLTLYDGFNCNTDDESIYAGIRLSQNRETPLTINLQGAATITGIGIYSEYGSTSNITISGPGSLTINSGTDGIQATGSGKVTIEGGTINSTGQTGSGIYTVGDLDIKGGTVYATGNSGGIYVFSGKLNITGGTVTATAYDYGTNKYSNRGGIWLGNDNNNAATISGGTVTASGKYGIYTDKSALRVESGVTSVTLIGTSQAIYNKLYNNVNGTGWTDTEGTADKTIIETSTEGQNVYQYKKIVFPSDEKEYVKVTFKVVNGSWNNGSTTDQTVTLDKGKSLTADQIPAVGEKPNAGYKAGSWDTTPDTTSAINSDTTFTYTYKAKDPVKVTVSVVPAEGGTVTSDPADLSAVAQGAEVTLTASHNAGYVLDKWEVTSGGVKLSSETGETTSFTTGEENVAITAHFKKAEPMVKQVEFVFVNKNTSKRGLPDNIKETTLNVKIEIKKDGKTVSSVTNVEFPINKETGSSVKQNLTFTPGLADFDTFAYTFAGSVSPAQLEEDVTSQDPDFEPKKYNLSVRMDAQMEKDKKSILFYIDWDDGSSVAGPEIIKVYALPEDAIGAYKLRDDGTKEYLIFHTYAICMNWLGSDELCRGYERCFHKESPYANPFVKP